MLDTKSLRQNNTYEFNCHFAISLLMLNALYWLQCDEDKYTKLPDNYASPIPLKNFNLLDDIDLEEVGTDFDMLPHFQYLSNLQRLGVWHDIYLRYLANSSLWDNCLVDSAGFSLIAILRKTVDDELIFGSSVQSKVDKFSRRIALYQLEIFTFDDYPVHSPAARIYEFPLTFEEACSLIPLEYEVCTDEETLEKKKYLFNALNFSLPREQLIEELRSLHPNEYGTFLHINAPYLECNLDAAENIINKYGDEYFLTPRSIDDERIDRWNELLTYGGIEGNCSFLELDINDINSSYVQVNSAVDRINQEAEEDSFASEISVDYFLIKDYVASVSSLSREQAMLQLVQLVLYKLYSGKSFRLEDVEKLSEIAAPFKLSSSVQSASAVAAYQCGVLIKMLGIEPCEFGLSAIAELFPSLGVFFERGLSPSHPQPRRLGLH